MKKALIIIGALLLLLLPVPANSSDDWQVYFFGVNWKSVKELNVPKVVAGIATSILTHTAGHYLYAGMNEMKVRQNGLSEVLQEDYPAKQRREFSQAGMFMQNVVGVILTTIPATRKSDFTKGYVAAAFVQTAISPAWGNRGDLRMSNRNGGDGDVEYAAYSSIAVHNVLRVNWKESENGRGK